LYSSQLIPVDDTTLLAATAWAYSFFSDDWGYSTEEISSKYTRVLGEAGESLVFGNGCSSSYTVSMGCAGNIVASDPYTEVITHCSGCSDSSGLRMHRMIRSDSARVVWVRPDVRYDNMICLPEMPGSFLGFHTVPLLGDTLFQFDADGNRVQFVTPIPGGTIGWVYPFGPGEPYLQAVIGDTIALYEVAVTTGTDDGGEESPIPKTLSIDRLHPNPFNTSQRIPVMVPVGRQLTVEIFNLLGQRTAVLFDGKAAKSFMEIDWQAQGCPSGVYFVRASTPEQTCVVRSILLK